VELYAEGGRACEYFFHVLKNPGDEVSFHMAGKVLDEPMTPTSNTSPACAAGLSRWSRW
jgi:hypothetical protein